MKKIVIIGVGLIGGAIGKAAIARGLADEVVGVCRRDVSLEKALKAILSKSDSNADTCPVNLPPSKIRLPLNF